MTDKSGAVDLDQMSTLEQTHRAIHLGEQPRDRCLARPGVAEEDEVLRCRDLRQPVPLPLGLYLQKGDEGADLVLDRLESDQRVELRLELRHRPRGLRPPELVGDPVSGVRSSRGLGQALAQNPQSAGDVLEWIPSHAWKCAPQTRDYALSRRWVGSIS